MDKKILNNKLVLLIIIIIFSFLFYYHYANLGVFPIDTFAFFVGSKFGETYIAKKISPNKTLEGLIGGLLASLFFGVIVFHNAQLPYVFAIYFVLGGFFAFMGDLLISYFKRQSGVKDTGTILPGHGGILDRIDSHLLATPFLLIIIIAIYSL